MKRQKYEEKKKIMLMAQLRGAKVTTRSRSNRKVVCGSVGKAVACNARGPQFESSHQQNLY